MKIIDWLFSDWLFAILLFYTGYGNNSLYGVVAFMSLEEMIGKICKWTGIGIILFCIFYLFGIIIWGFLKLWGIL